MSCAVFAIVRDHRACLAHLREAGFRAAEISVLAPGPHAADPAEPGPPPRRTGVGWLPAVGAILACGPLAALLRGGAAGIALPLAGLGVPDYAAHRYEDALARGGAVVAVHTDNGFEIDTLTEMLRADGGECVAAA